MATPPGSVTPPATGYNYAAIEVAGVGFLGGFAGALVTGDPILTALEVGLVAFAAALGYHAYQTS